MFITFRETVTMKRKLLINNQNYKPKRNCIDFEAPLEALAINKGLNHVFEEVFKYLNAQELGLCRLVCQSFTIVITNSKQWFRLQLKFLLKTPTPFLDHESDDKHNSKSLVLIETQFPEWKATNEHYLKNEGIGRLKNFVKCFWRYHNNSKKCLSASPLHVFNDSMELLFNTPFDFRNTNKHGMAAIHYLCKENEISMVRKLIMNAESSDIDFNIKDKNGWTPAHYACQYGSLEMVKLLVQYYQDKQLDFFQITNKGRTLFQMAVLNDNIQVLKYLFQHFKEHFIDTSDIYGYPIIVQAILWSNKATVKYLLDIRSVIGARLDSRDIKGCTVLHKACEKNRVDVLTLLWKCLKEDLVNIDFNTPDNRRETPLHLMGMYGNVTIMKILKRLRPNFLDQCQDQMSCYQFARALILANRNPNSEVFSFLMERFLNNLGQNIIHIACKNNYIMYVEVFSFMIDRRSAKFKNECFNAADKDGNTPLHLACLHGHINIIEKLLTMAKSKRIDAFAQNLMGDYPKDLVSHSYRSIYPLFDILHEDPNCMYGPPGV